MNTSNNTTTFADSILNAAFAGVQNIDNADQVNTLLDKYGLNWTVSKQPLMLPTGGTTPYFGIVRDDKQITFSTCKHGYVPFQNSELAEMLIRLSEKTGYAIHGGGMFNDGGKLYLQLQSPNKIQGIGSNSDTVNGFLTGINSHDGTTSLKWGETNITISCRNTFMAACKAIKSSARHTQSIQNKVEQAIQEVSGIVIAEKNLFDTFITLAEIPVTRTAIARIVKDITEVDTLLSKSEIETKYTTYAVNRSADLLAAISKEMGQKGQTMWGLMSGVTNYTTHAMPVPKRENARLESLYTGSGYSINNDAFNTIKELAKI